MTSRETGCFGAKTRRQRLGHAANHRRDGGEQVGGLGRQPVAEDAAVRHARGEDPRPIERVRLGQLVDQPADELHVVDRLALGGKRRRLATVVPVPVDPLRVDDQEPLAAGRGIEPEPRRAGRVAPATMEDQQHGRRPRGAFRRVHEVLAPAPVDLDLSIAGQAREHLLDDRLLVPLRAAQRFPLRQA